MDLLSFLKPKPAPRPQICPSIIAEREALAATRAAAQAAAEAHAAEAKTRSAELAERIAAEVRVDLSAEDVLCVAELAVAIQMLAADKGFALATPDAADLAKTCEDLATRNARRGYSAFVPIGPLSGAVYPYLSPSGSDIGYDSWNGWLKTLAAELPEDHSTRLHRLQMRETEAAKAGLAALAAHGVHYES